MNTLKRFLAAAVIASIAILLMESFASAQCASGQCSSRNANLGESISQLPAPIPTPAPAPAPQISYYTAPAQTGGSYAHSYAGTGTAPAQVGGQLIVQGYTYAPPQPAPQYAYVIAPPAPQVGTFAGSSAGTNVVVTTPAVGFSTQVVGGGNVGCSRGGGCGGGGGFLGRILRPRARSVSVSRSVSRS